MTIDNIEATPEVAHAAMMEPSATAEGIAFSALAIAHSDVAKACEQISRHDTNEAVQIIKEAAKQLEFATRMLTGTYWNPSALY